MQIAEFCLRVCAVRTVPPAGPANPDFRVLTSPICQHSHLPSVHYATCHLLGVLDKLISSATFVGPVNVVVLILKFKTDLD